jgi:hypothetical protein
MRNPTTAAAVLEWHTEAMRQIDMRLPHDVVNDDPQCGWFECRLVAGGPMLPARIWMEDDIEDVTGELLDEPKLRCQVVFVDKDPIEFWSSLAKRPITQERYDQMMELGDWIAEWAPGDPLNEPHKRIQARNIPMPSF